MVWWSTLAVMIATAGVATWLTAALARPGAWLSVLDLPNERSLHVRPTPRTGGLAVLVAIAVGWIALAFAVGVDRQLAGMTAGALAIAAVSFADDRKSVSAQARLGVHLAAAAALVAAGVRFDQVPLPGVDIALGPYAGAALTLPFVVWMTNLYNFMDGMDGFAAGMTATGFGFLALAMHGAPASPYLLVVAAAALGFLRHNFPPATIFLGDVGAAPLGFLAAGFAIAADRGGAFPLWASVLVFSPFVVDATATLARRAVRGEKVWHAHRTHAYQRLVQAGWGHRRTVLWEYALMVACGTTAVATYDASVRVQQLVVVVAVVAYAGLILTVARIARR